MQILLCLVSALSGFYVRKSVIFFERDISSIGKKILFWILVAYSAFSIVGSRMFVYPLDMNINISQVLVWFVTVLWLVPIILLFLSWYGDIEYAGEKHFNEVFFGVLAAILLVVPACFALYGFNPAISTADSETCLAIYAHSIRNMPNWHPPFYCMLLKAIITVWDSTYAVVIVQMLFWMYVVLEGLIFLKRRGYSPAILMIVAFLLGINPANYLHICTIWKDIPYGITLLWLTIICTRLVLDKNVNKKWFIYIEFIIASVFTFFIRQNGIVVYVLVMAYIIGALGKTNIKALVSILVSVMLVLLIRFPIYSYIGVQETGGGIYIGLSQDILGVYFSDGDLSEETIDMVNVLTDNNDEYVYSPYWASSSYDLDVNMYTFIVNYIDTFVKNPVIMTRAILCRQDGVWNIFDGENAILGGINFTDTRDSWGVWNDYYPMRVENEYTYKLLEFQNLLGGNQFLYLLMWRTGIYTLFVVIAFFTAIIKKINYKFFLTFIPFIGQIISLLLSTGWSEFRYYWPLILMAVFIIMLIPTMRSKEGEWNERNA